MRLTLIALVVCALLSGCGLATRAQGPLALAEADSDFESYQLRRVGLVPFAGPSLSAEHGRTLQAAFLHEFAQNSPFEVVMLDHAALHEVARSDPYRRGRLKPLTVLELSRRFNLDGILMGTVTHMNAYPPQVLGIEIDLVSCETGLPIWTSRLQLDAADAQVRQALMAYARDQDGAGGSEGATLALISPTRFARFAASQVAESLPSYR